MKQNLQYANVFNISMPIFIYKGKTYETKTIRDSLFNIVASNPNRIILLYEDHNSYVRLIITDDLFEPVAAIDSSFDKFKYLLIK